MRMLYRFLPLCLILTSTCAWAAEPAPVENRDLFPILAWIGPPADQTTVERYRELAECGFTHNFSGFPNADAMAKALDVGRATGMKVFVSCPELSSDPDGTAKRFMAHPALAGYHLRDEPSAADFAALAKWVGQIQSVDREHPCYINLFPNYADAGQLGAPTYAQHVDRFIAEVPVPFISFDHYPVVGQSLRPQWYENLEVISAAARKANKPFWAFALSVAHGPYPVPTIAHLRVQVYSNLAYGAQGLQYFTYWTVPSETWNFHEAPILPDGRRGAVYDRVRHVNREVQALRGVFLGASVVSVGHTGEKLPAGTRRYQPAPPVQSLTTGAEGAVVSQLSKGDRRFLVVVNRDVNKAMPLDLACEPAAEVRVIRKDGTFADVVRTRARINLAPGDAVIFTWTQR
jgi:hypothetical protein